MRSNTQLPFQHTTIDPGLAALLSRLAHQAQLPDFQGQRELGLAHALRPYLEPGSSPFPLAPLDEEIELATLYLYSDYVPTDGHPTLIEQVRDLITEHVPHEEREWLDAVRHSYMDLLEVCQIHICPASTRLSLRSLGDAQEFRVTESQLSPSLQQGQVLLTRLIRRPDRISLPGVALALSNNLGHVLLKFLREAQREIEIRSGEFALSDWTEFAKKYGNLFLGNLSRVRSGVSSAADAQIRYRDSRGQTYLYAIAIYEHQEHHVLEQEFNRLHKFQQRQGKTHSTEVPVEPTPSVQIWEHTRAIPEQELAETLVARITLTPTQLFIEADTGKQLDTLKHELARRFGFSLHFRGEITKPPKHIPPQVDLLSDSFYASPITVSQEDDLKILQPFLESVYLEWAERPCPSLQNESPRHVATRDGHKSQIAALIDQMEQDDLAYQRTGKRGYDYNILRRHIGLS